LAPILTVTHDEYDAESVFVFKPIAQAVILQASGADLPTSLYALVFVCMSIFVEIHRLAVQPSSEQLQRCLDFLDTEYKEGRLSLRQLSICLDMVVLIKRVEGI